MYFANKNGDKIEFSSGKEIDGLEDLKPGDMKEVTTEEGDGVAICIEGFPTPEKLRDALAMVMDKIELKHFVLDDKLVPVPADDMPRVKWVEYMKKSSQLQATRYGKYRVVTEFVGIALAKSEKKPQLFATKITCDGKTFGMRKAYDIDGAATLHRTAVQAVKSQTFLRMPWDVVIDRVSNGYWV